MVKRNSGFKSSSKDFFSDKIHVIGHSLGGHLAGIDLNFYYSNASSCSD